MALPAGGPAEVIFVAVHETSTRILPMPASHSAFVPLTQELSSAPAPTTMKWG